jgi:diguanylate cyclase (GGDEF)-like protein
VQGLVAGVVGLNAASTPAEAIMLAACAMIAAIAINSVGRWLILLDRRASPLRDVWLRGVAVDGVEAVITVPILASLVLVAPQSELLVATVLASLLSALAIAQRMRESSVAALEAEQANARRDTLTNAPNRRAFEEVLVQAHARIVRGDQPAGLFVVDIDRFKSINDRFGHRVGDLVLMEVVRRLEDGLRTGDVVARWGGEEITVLAPGIRSRRGLEQFAERIRRLIGDVPLIAGRNTLPVTVSVGGTLLDGSLSPTEAVHRADTAMYEAKRTRDAWIVSLPPRISLRLETA